jgi:hypothetical protein
MRHRGHHQHHQISALDRFGYIGGYQMDGHQTGLYAVGLNAALIADRVQAFFAPCVKPDFEATPGQVGSGGQPTVTGPHDRYAADIHRLDVALRLLP